MSHHDVHCDQTAGLLFLTCTCGWREHIPLPTPLWLLGLISDHGCHREWAEPLPAATAGQVEAP